MRSQSTLLQAVLCCLHRRRTLEHDVAADNVPAAAVLEPHGEREGASSPTEPAATRAVNAHAAAKQKGRKRHDHLPDEARGSCGAHRARI